MISFQLTLILSLCLSIFIYELFSLKLSYFKENMIYVKLDPGAPNTADSDDPKSGVTQNIRQDNVLKHSLLSQHLMDIPTVAEIHGTLYKAWQYDSPGGVQMQSPKSFNYFKVFKARK